MLPIDKLTQWCEKSGLQLNQEMYGKLDQYAAFLVEYNEKVNLTAITEPEKMAVKHFYDSLLLLRAVSPAQGAALIDVGTGAGFPGVPVKVARPDLDLTLLDSLQKRIVFLQQLSQRLSIPYVCLHARAEEAGRREELREHFDVATARAVAALPVLCEYCLPFVRMGGVFAAMKAKGTEEELEKAQAAIDLLGGKVEKVEHFLLPDGSERSIVCIKKISRTPAKFPRPSAKMAKTPL